MSLPSQKQPYCFLYCFITEGVCIYFHPWNGAIILLAKNSVWILLRYFWYMPVASDNQLVIFTLCLCNLYFSFLLFSKKKKKIQQTLTFSTIYISVISQASFPLNFQEWYSNHWSCSHFLDPLLTQLLFYYNKDFVFNHVTRLSHQI